MKNAIYHWIIVILMTTVLFLCFIYWVAVIRDGKMSNDNLELSRAKDQCETTLHQVLNDQGR